MPRGLFKAPRMPARLTPAAKTKWRYIVPKLGKLGILTELDVSVLALHCQAAAEVDELTQQLADTGWTAGGQNGAVIRNPLALVRKQAIDVMLETARRLGLSPQDRASIGLTMAQAKELTNSGGKWERL